MGSLTGPSSPRRFPATHREPSISQSGEKGLCGGRDPSCTPQADAGDRIVFLQLPPSWGQPPLWVLSRVLCRRTTVLGREPWTRGNWFLRSHLPKNCGVGVLLPLGRTKGGIRSGRTSQSSTNHRQAQAGMGVTAVRDPGSLPASGMGFTLVVPLCATHSPSHSSPSDIPSPSCSSWCPTPSNTPTWSPALPQPQLGGLWAGAGAPGSFPAHAEPSPGHRETHTSTFLQRLQGSAGSPHVLTSVLGARG